MTTLKDIAELTGVSVNTVSRALKDMPDIGAKTKERVRRAADTLGYTPNVLARGLATRRSFTLGLVATELANPVRSAFIEALRRLSLDKGYQLLVGGFETDGEAEGQLRQMLARGVDGLILGNVGGILSEKPYWSVLEAALRSGTPTVVFHNAQTQLLDGVFIDYPRLAEELTRHLLEKHRLQDIRFAATRLDYDDRGAGYRSAMRDASLERHMNLIPLTDCHMATARAGMRAFLAGGQRPEAVVCHNDLVAIGVMAALRDHGLRVPEDVAVAGVDNIELADYLHPSLTSAGAAPETVAETLFNLLLSRLDGSYTGPGRRVELPFKTFFRGSCGCR